MANIAMFLASLMPSLTKSVLGALGFGVVTIVGLQALSGQVESYVYSSVGGMPADMLGLLNLAGMSTGLNIVLGAVTARLTLYALTNSRRIIGA